MQRFDTLVVGTGVAGQTAAGELAEAGLRVAIVDRREYGGTCALRGCTPKRALHQVAETVERARSHAENGVTGRPGLDWPSLLAFKRTFTDPAPVRTESWLADAGVTLLHGEARFVSPEAIAIGDVEYTADHFVLAPGAASIPLGIPGADLVHDAEAFMSAAALPGRVVFIGGGYISFEFAHVAAAAGAEVTIAHRSARLLKEFDPDLVAMLVTSYRDAGITVVTDAPVTAVRRNGDALEIRCGDGQALACDMAVHGAGRAPDIAHLALDVGDVAYGRRGIEVDGAMRSTTNPRVFAAGDAAAAGAPLTPVGIAQARVAVRNILEPGSATFSPAVTASVVFTDPPLASVGIDEAEVRLAGADVDVALTDTSQWATSRRAGVRVSGAKLIVERSGGRILGAHLLGHGADEVVNVFAAAMTGGLTTAELRSTLWAYPTAGSDIVYLLP